MYLILAYDRDTVPFLLTIVIMYHFLDYDRCTAPRLDCDRDTVPLFGLRYGIVPLFVLLQGYCAFFGQKNPDRWGYPAEEL